MSAGRPFNDQELELLSAYLDGMLTTEERSALEARLANEPALRRELESLRQTVQLMKTLPPVRAPRDFTLNERMLRRRWLMFPATVGFSALSAAAAIVLFAFASLLLSQNGAKPIAPAAEQVAQLPTQADTLTTVVDSYSYAATASTGADTGAAPENSDQNTADGRFVSPALLTATSADLQAGGGGQPNAKSSTALTASPPLEDAAVAGASVPQQDALTAPDAAPLTEERQATLSIMNAQTDLAEAPSTFGSAEASQGALSNAAPAQAPVPTGAPGAAAEPPSVMMAVPTATLPDTPTATATDTPTETPTFTPTATTTPTMTATHTPTATLTPAPVPAAPVTVGPDTIGVGLLVAAAVLLVIAAGTAWTIWRRR
jgi:hypothetical protein